MCSASCRDDALFVSVFARLSVFGSAQIAGRSRCLTSGLRTLKVAWRGVRL